MSRCSRGRRRWTNVKKTRKQAPKRISKSQKPVTDDESVFLSDEDFKAPAKNLRRFERMMKKEGKEREVVVRSTRATTVSPTPMVEKIDRKTFQAISRQSRSVALGTLRSGKKRPRMSLDVDTEDIERIIGSRVTNGVREFLIQWNGYGP